MIRRFRRANLWCRRLIQITQTQCQNPGWTSWYDIIAGLKVLLSFLLLVIEVYVNVKLILSVISFLLMATAFRGLGRILGAARQIDDGMAIPNLLNFSEKAQLDTRGYVTRDICHYTA
jgi:hypothetical protein